MKLSQKEADILGCIELRGEIAVEDIRKETGYREHTIRYCLKRLKDRGIIRKSPFVNVSMLGYGMHNVFFSVGSENNRLKSQLTKALIDTPEVLWLAEMGL